LSGLTVYRPRQSSSDRCIHRSISSTVVQCSAVQRRVALLALFWPHQVVSGRSGAFSDIWFGY